MLELVYVISMAVAFTYKYDGVMVSYWLKYIIAGVWIAAWIFDVVFRKEGKLEGTVLFYVKQFATPLVLIYIWSILLWIVNRPADFNSVYFSRASSQMLSLFLATIAPIAACHFFKRKTIQLSVYAIALSTLFNVIRAIQVYGMSIFISFMKSAWIVDFDVSRPTYRISQMLEVHDATLACGFYLINYLFFCDPKTKNKKLNIILLLLAIYIGFKRVAFVAVLVVGMLLFLIKTREQKFKHIINVIAISVAIIAFGYIIAIKTGFLELVSLALGIDFSGRFVVYDIMSDMISLLPTSLGCGYGYLNKFLNDKTTLASHSDIVRMYIELGCIPYILWLYYYLKAIPTRVFNKYGTLAGRVILASTIYVFVTYFVGNAMTMFCIEYSYVLLPVALSYSSDTETARRRIRVVFGRRNKI